MWGYGYRVGLGFVVADVRQIVTCVSLRWVGWDLRLDLPSDCYFVA